MGSIDFYAVARSVLLVGRVKDDDSLRAVVQIKNNLAEFGHSKAFRLEAGQFIWIGDYDITADELLNGVAPKESKKGKAIELLKRFAKEGIPVQSNDIFEAAQDENISKRTMEMTKKELGIVAKKIGNSWYWELGKLSD